jgi:hypothetical protein
MKTVARAPIAVLLVGIVASVCLLIAPSAVAASGPGWSIRSLAQPTNFSSVPNAICEVNAESELCDSYTLIVTNVGHGTAEPPIAISDVLPAGMRVVHIVGEDMLTGEELTCSKTLVQCVDGLSVPAGDRLKVTINVIVNEPGLLPEALNAAEVSGGGASPASVTKPTKISTEPASFGIQDFSFQPFGSNGTTDTEAGGHPVSLSTSLYFSSLATTSGGGTYGPAEEVKNILVNLPPGLVGNPLATPRCPQHDLLLEFGKTACPANTRIGTLVFEASPGTFRTSENPTFGTTAVYNMEPDAGYPAEFGFSYLSKPVFMFASLVREASGYGLRVEAPGLPSLETIGVSLLLFGNPTQRDTGFSGIPFFTNPVNCGGPPAEATLEADTWTSPDVFQSASSDTYPQITDCNALQFQPTFAVRPDTTQADEPAGYNFAIQNPQFESESSPGTPEPRNVTVTLPSGVSLSPSAADGLGACPAEGSNGINIGSSDVTPQGQDLGDSYATELGNGQGGPGESPYDDGLWHIAPGHCPANSIVGSMEVQSPLLAKPLTGHMYVAQPGCGGEGQAGCTPTDAGDGNLFGVYLEVAGSGVIVKLHGSALVDPTTGQLTLTFRENPQLPFSDLRVTVGGGPRAPLANPLACGVATASSDLSPWSAPITPDATPLSSFTVDWDGQGGRESACPATPPLNPTINAGMSTSLAGGSFSPFTFTLSRHDRQQYLSQISVTTPPGLLGMLSDVTPCGEPQASQGTCSAASEIGTVTVAVGAGSHPYWVTGNVYLTSGYRGAPLGLTIVVPAKAGPFNLGYVVVRSAVAVDPRTAQITVTSDPLPQIVDGVPLRVQTVHIEVNRPESGFTFNPTNCEVHQILATAFGAQGGVAPMSVPFTAAGCSKLPFGPKFTVSTQHNGEVRGHGASLAVKLALPHSGPQSGRGVEANVRYVKVSLPKALPARLTTLQKACTEQVFAENAADCPPASFVGMAIAHTPILHNPLTGPAILVSHGGEAFPDLVILLQGENGIMVELTGNTGIKNNITTSTFASVPDAPVNNFELILPEGEHSALAATSNLCQQALVMPTAFIAQNGATLNQSTHMEVEGCPNALSLKFKKVRGSSVTLGVSVPTAGRLSASGKGLSRASKASHEREEVRLTLHIRLHGRFRSKIRLTFTPSSGKDRKKLGKSLSLRV